MGIIKENNISDYDYFANKRTDRIYLSKSLNSNFPMRNEDGQYTEINRPYRIVSKIIENKEAHKFIKDGKEVSLRITNSERQEIKAKFYEDTRGISTLQIQKYTKETGLPHNTYFTFTGNEINILFNFIRNIALLPISNKGNARFDESILNEISLSKEQILHLISENPDIIDEIINTKITKEEIINLGYRKKQIEIFEKLLTDDDYFNLINKQNGNKGEESVWQNFFENNTWIFGYGLNYIFNSPLNDKKLEQVVSGYDFNNSGKRIDAFMKTKGIINSFSFAEIKTHNTNLLKQIKNSYRGESWAISDELSGAIAQTQKSVYKSTKSLASKINIKDKTGDLTGEQIFMYQPKSFIIIGKLSEFKTEFGVNEDKYSSFELFRRNQINPEIITFDELFERAKFIIKENENTKA